MVRVFARSKRNAEKIKKDPIMNYWIPMTEDDVDWVNGKVVPTNK
jgi:hypothetical protein